MKRNLTAAAIAIFFAVAVVYSQDGPKAEPSEGYMLRAKASGIFGLPKNRTVEAVFYLSPTKLRIDLATGESSSIVDLDCRHLIEASHTEREYHLQSFDKLPFRWNSRREDLELIAKRIQAGLDGGRLTKKAAREQAGKSGLHVNPDGSFDVKQVPKIIRTGKSKSIAGYTAHEVIVKENEIEVFRLWLTEDISRPFDVVKFYTAIGYLSPEMVKKVGELKGFPVEIHLVLHVKKKKMEVDMELTEFLPAKVYGPLFTVPAAYKLKKVQLAGAKIKCSFCGEPLGDKRVRLKLDGVRYEVCSKEHGSELQFEFAAALEGGYTTLLKSLLQKGGSYNNIKEQLYKILKGKGINPDEIKEWLREQEDE